MWDGEGLQLVRAGDIRWCEAERNYVRLHVPGAAHLFRSTLQNLERRLDPDRFVRVHRSSIVNVEYLARLEPWFHGEYVAFLSDGTRIRVSRTYAARLRELVGSGGLRRRVRQRLEILVDEGDHHAAFADARGDALDRVAAHVAGGEDAGDARFERERAALERPTSRGSRPVEM